MKDTDPIVRPVQLQQELGVARVTLWRYTRDGVIPPPVQIGPRLKGWRRSTVEAIKDGRIKGSAC